MNPVRKIRFTAGTNTPLADNPQYSNAARFALALHRYESVYTDIPKNACTTMRVSMAIAHGFISGPEDYEWAHHNISRFQCNLRELVNAKYTFTVLRCPFERAVSAFIDKIVKDSSGHRYLTFHEFLKHLNNDNLVKRNLHWRQQLDFLIYDEYDDYFAVEEMSNTQRVLKQKLDYTIVDARSSSLHGRETLTRVDDRNYATVPVSDLREMRTQGIIPETSAFFDQATLNLLVHLYQSDIQLYKEKIGTSEVMGKLLLS